MQKIKKWLLGLGAFLAFVAGAVVAVLVCRGTSGPADPDEPDSSELARAANLEASRLRAADIEVDRDLGSLGDVVQGGFDSVARKADDLISDSERLIAEAKRSAGENY